jgi:ACS family hexuronate transporter-like MFS transporter
MLAPPVATWIALRYGWRAAFVVTGLFGLAWLPLWGWMSRRVPSAEPSAPAPRDRALLRDRRLWSFAAANALSMIPYMLWTNWTTLYLVDARGLSMRQAAWYAWVPPVLAAAGGFAGGWLSLAWMRAGAPAPTARFRVCVTAAVLSLGTAAIPAAPTPLLAVGGIALSFFAAAGFSVNIYTLPLDIFGGARAAFAVSLLTCSAGAAGLLSPLFGRIIDLHGYGPVTAVAAFMPLAACAVLRVTRSIR